MSTKSKLITQTVKLSFLDNCKDVFDEQTRPFFVQMLTNGNIRDELSKIIEKNSQLFGKNVVNNQMLDTRIIDEMNESSSELKVKEKASPSKIAIMEEGEKESSFHNNIHNNNFNPSIEISEFCDNPLLKMKQSVFSDLNVEDPNRIISSQMLTKSKFNLTSSLPKNNRNKRINENANAGSLPKNTTSPSVWITVKNWLDKAIKKIGQMTNDFLHFLSTQRKALLIDFGILILGVALLFTAGVIQDPSSLFQTIFKKLISFLGF
eukprot:TRINITY_DN17620_c1_g1_i1.p1 TRINITY_DN17620_c1_g1~~TRINITY_DN17620_c1_g1_i1.p1  ORF type:complete len:264 (+),score=88.70 TRINITY_DN17620_c1_g1_i1:185-976(+)